MLNLLSGPASLAQAHNWPAFAERVLLALVVFAIAFVLARIASAAVGRLRGRVSDGRSSLYVIQKLTSYILIIAGLFAGAETLGVNLTSLAVFAGSVGVGIGLGLQGIAKDFIAGLIIIFDPQLGVGDFIEIDADTVGEIVEVGPRATLLKNPDNISVVVPNSKLIENKLTNWTLHGATRRIHIPFETPASVDKRQVRKVVIAAAEKLSFTLKGHPRQTSEVWLNDFDQGVMKFELVVWPNGEAVKRPGAMRAAYMWALEDALLCAGLLKEKAEDVDGPAPSHPSENDAANHIASASDEKSEAPTPKA